MYVYNDMCDGGKIGGMFVMACVMERRLRICL